LVPDVGEFRLLDKILYLVKIRDVIVEFLDNGVLLKPPDVGISLGPHPFAFGDVLPLE
jgi:hypothetical protein